MALHCRQTRTPAVELYALIAMPLPRCLSLLLSAGRSRAAWLALHCCQTSTAANRLPHATPTPHFLSTGRSTATWLLLSRCQPALPQPDCPMPLPRCRFLLLLSAGRSSNVSAAALLSNQHCHKHTIPCPSLLPFLFAGRSRATWLPPARACWCTAACASC